MPDCNNILLVTTEPLTDSLLDWLCRTRGDAAVVMLKLTADRDAVTPPPNWQLVRPVDLGSSEQLGKDILAFLTSVAETPLRGGKTFDRLFRLPGRISLWWAGPASRRHQDKPVYAALRAAWMLDKALRAVDASEVLILTARRDVAAILASQCANHGLRCEFTPGSAAPAKSCWAGRTRWLVATTPWLVSLPWRLLGGALLARLTARTRAPARGQRDRPAVVFTTAFPRHIRGDDPPTVWYWRELADALAHRAPMWRQHYLVRATGRRRHWAVLRRVAGALPIAQQHAPLGTFVRAAGHQVVAMLRLAHLEARPAYRKLFDFCGADVSWLYAPLIRRNVARLASWAVTVAASVKSLRAAGNVKLLIVNEEFYGIGMQHIAAARQLGIPTLGVQHGAIFPMHMIYTAPPAQLAGTPVCDRFAVYGPFAKQVITDLGAYPPERVWITGGPRFDPLVNAPPDRAAARQRLGFDPDKKIVLITTNFFRWFQDVARSVFDACKDRGDVLVCLKTHPRDFSLSVYEQLARQVGAANVRLFDDRFDDLMAACDVLIGGFSTTVMEAILLGRTTICVNFSDEEDRYPYVADGGSLPARSDEEMRIALDKALSGASDAELAAGRERFLERHLGPTAKGQAAKALADAIADFLDARPTGK